MEKERTVALQL